MILWSSVTSVKELNLCYPILEVYVLYCFVVGKNQQRGHIYKKPSDLQTFCKKKSYKILLFYCTAQNFTGPNAAECFLSMPIFLQIILNIEDFIWPELQLGIVKMTMIIYIINYCYSLLTMKAIVGRKSPSKQRKCHLRLAKKLRLID